MPSTLVVFFKEQGGDVPAVEWLKSLHATNEKAFLKCRAALFRLGLLGHELRRPDADYLRNGIHELRVRCGSVNYRLLYFFHGRNVSVVSHCVTKEATVPDTEINRAIARKAAFASNPALHTFRRAIDHD